MLLANKKSVLITSTALILSMVAGSAWAGGFALREQSAYYQGMSFAGNGTSGGSISAMYWNPATLTSAGQGLVSESHSSFIAPVSNIDGTFTPSGLVSGLTAGTVSTKGSGDMASDAWIPSTYLSYGLNENWYFGLGINAPFGLATKPDPTWAGQYYSRSSEVFSINVNPTVAYKVNEMFSVALGLQAEYFQVRLKSAYPFRASNTSFPPTSEVKGGSFGFGATAGLTVKPIEGTEIGLGLRSAVFHQLEGHFTNPGSTTPTTFGPSRTGIEANIITPEMVTLSAKQRITDQFRMLGTVEWTNWSRLGTVRLRSTNGTTTNPTGLPDLKFNYDDGWFFSVGGEYDWNEQVTLRAGVGYELSPIDEEIRSTRLPDNDRLWLSAGMSWQPAENLAFDIGYSHLIPADTQIDISPGHQDYNSNIGTYVADVDSQVNIFAASLRYKF
ncbi:transporter [Rhodobacterales bacterium]|nr:transporter [Rhodobacterales bacterium]